MSDSPMQLLAGALRQNGLIRFIEHFAELFPTSHLKDLVVDRIGPNRSIEVGGRTVTNFGSDSFLGLDQDPRVQEALRRGVAAWGTHNGASRALATVPADAHGTGVMGTRGRGTVYDALGGYDNTLVVGSLSKGFSCAGGFIGCTEQMKLLLKMRSNTYIFGGPVPPPYLQAICTVCDILASPEYDQLSHRLQSNLQRLTAGAARLGLAVLGGQTPIISVLVGDEADTLKA